MSERYVYAVTRRLPEEQRTDVGEDLRATIADRIATLAAERPDGDSSAYERLALEELGDPDRLAASYTGRGLHLIGPELYPAWERLLKLVLVVAVPAATVVVAVIDAFSGEPVGKVLGGALSLAINLTIQITFWVTVVFAVAERTSELPSSLGLEWDVHRLPDLPKQRGSLSDLIAGVVWLGVFGIAIIWQQVQSPIDDGLPLLDPDLWSFWLPLILVLLVAEAAFEFVKYRIGRWTFALATINVVLGALFAAPVVYLAATDQLLNPAAVAAIQKGWEGFDPTTVNTVVVIVTLAIWVGESVDGWRRAMRG